MNTPISLEEAYRIIENSETGDAINNQDVQDFIGHVEEAGKTILGSKKDVGKYVESASTFMLAAVMAECLKGNGRDSKDMQVALLIMQNPSMFQLILGYAFIYAVGIVSVEELY